MAGTSELIPPRRGLRRGTSAAGTRVTNMELFFDLVYVFAVTQLSHYLLGHLSWAGAAEAGLLLDMVWQLWAYTTWLTNWADPDRIPVRAALLVMMLISLVMSAALPRAFDTGGLSAGLLVGGAYLVIQAGRSAFAVWALRDGLRQNFQRILCWTCLSGGLALIGGLTVPPARWWFWLAAVVADHIGGWTGFWVPGLGRASTREWDVAGGHFAERCQGFILIALGESIVVTGSTLTRLLEGPLAGPHGHPAPSLTAFAVAFIGSAGLWWLYFDRSAEAGEQSIAGSADPGALARSAYHFIHPVMVAGIIVVAAADEIVVADPLDPVTTPAAWLILGGTALFIAGHAAYKAVAMRVVSWTRLAALAVLGLLGLLVPQVNNLTLEACAAAVIIAIAVADYLNRDGQATAATGEAAVAAD